MSIEAQDGDSLTVRSIADRVSNPIAIEGATELRGVIGWSPGLKVADVFADLEGDVLPTADLDVSLVIRRKNSLNDIEVIPFSLSTAKNQMSSSDNLALRRLIVLYFALPSAAIDELDLLRISPTPFGETRDDDYLEAMRC